MGKRWKSTNFVQNGVTKVDMGESVPLIEFSFTPKPEVNDIASFLKEVENMSNLDILDVETQDKDKLDIQNNIRKQRFLEEAGRLLEG